MYANMGGYSDEEEQEEEEDEEDEEQEDDTDTMSVASSATSSSALVVHSGSKNNEYNDTDDVDGAMKRLAAADDAARSVFVDRPFMLANTVKLREYQHIGLNWLVSLHERRLNGILADEMGLGKTIQTIALLAYLMSYRGIWGPHLIVVPTSCLVNWETEFKRFAPAFKVLTYYGSPKQRKNLRNGWSRLNSFHVCITSYQLVVQDSNAFRRKRWYYMVLDEAHNIKNFKSQRWQTLLNFNTQRRLLLTGTPLQNNLMELWSLMHFLMPHIFRSRKEFSYWFSNPLSGMVEGNRGVNNDLITRLHSIMRPFLLRRLKKDVAKQLPGKYEHVLMCKLSKRQMLLYEEFMARSAVRSALKGGNFMGMMNCLMQLRKVCNHPDLFEMRAIESPFNAPAIAFKQASLVTRAMENAPLKTLSSDLWRNLWSIEDDEFVCEEIKRLRPSEAAFLTVDDLNIPLVKFSSPSGSRSPGGKSNSVQGLFARQLSNLYVGQRKHRLEYNFQVSEGRCSRPRINFNWRTVVALAIRTFHLPLSVESRTDPHRKEEISHCWYDLVRSIPDRAEDMLDIIKAFTFVLPKVSSSGPVLVTANPNTQIAGTSVARQRLCADLKPMYDRALAPFYPASSRQNMFFPDRKLVQFDSGKLQTLCDLLRKLKRGGHKCLIFTQMSKMLDILEVFLNLHAYTYVRLDGSTGIDKRQKLMDRFNGDPKLFCFILSTRSGGLGINLTGADTVIFYDSDWNPAMDAQAQDRAHRIGQTRDVHIYRLVSASTVEENILTKARQKRHLDFLVMTEGNFSEESLFSSKGLKDLFGEDGENQGVDKDKDKATVMQIENDNTSSASSAKEKKNMSASEIEQAMAAAEDEEDIHALKAARIEASKEEAEFDENVQVEIDKLSDQGDGDESIPGAPSLQRSASLSSLASDKSRPVSPTTAAATEEKDMEAEFASWQAKIGPDIGVLESALKPVERYALKLRTDVDPYYSMFFLTEQQRLESLDAGTQSEEAMWDVEEIEREKEEEEYRAMNEGELLATNLTARDVRRMKSWYAKERTRLMNERRKRMLTGASWEVREDAVTFEPYYYNIDTRECRWTKPKILEEHEVMKQAELKGYNAAPKRAITTILSFLSAAPERLRAAETCISWAAGSKDKIFHLRVLAVETGARSDTPEQILERYGPNVFSSVEKAISMATKGDTITLDAGHHWETNLPITKAVRILGQQEDPSRCVLELTGSIDITPTAKSVRICGVTMRRPRKLPMTTACVSVTGRTNVSLFQCVMNNEGASGSTILVAGGAVLQLHSCTVRGGVKAGITAIAANVLCARTHISDNVGHGIFALQSALSFHRTHVNRNGLRGFCLMGRCVAVLNHIEIKSNAQGQLDLVDEQDLTIRSKDVQTDQRSVNMLKEANVRAEKKLARAPSPRKDGIPSSIPSSSATVTTNQQSSSTTNQQSSSS